MKAILKGVVEEGTGTKAAIPGVTVAGKTGTAQKVVGGIYSHAHFYATFAGFAPVDNPQSGLLWWFLMIRTRLIMAARWQHRFFLKWWGIL